MAYVRTISQWREYEITSSLTDQDIMDLVNSGGAGFSIYQIWRSGDDSQLLLRFAYNSSGAEVTVNSGQYLRVAYNTLTNYASAFMVSDVALADDSEFMFLPDEES